MVFSLLIEIMQKIAIANYCSTSTNKNLHDSRLFASRGNCNKLHLAFGFMLADIFDSVNCFFGLDTHHILRYH